MVDREYSGADDRTPVYDPRVGVHAIATVIGDMGGLYTRFEATGRYAEAPLRAIHVGPMAGSDREVAPVLIVGPAEVSI